MAGRRDWEARSSHARRVYLKHGDLIEHGLSESCLGCSAMYVGAGPLPSVPSEDGGHVGADRERQAPVGHRRGPHKGRDRRKGDEEGMLSYSKLGVGEAPPSQMSLGGAASGSSNPSESAPSGMSVDETVDQGAKRVRLGPAPSNDNRDQAMEFVDWDGHRILDMSGPAWDFVMESHLAGARYLARASRPHFG